MLYLLLRKKANETFNSITLFMLPSLLPFFSLHHCALLFFFSRGNAFLARALFLFFSLQLMQLIHWKSRARNLDCSGDHAYWHVTGATSFGRGGGAPIVFALPFALFRPPALQFWTRRGKILKSLSLHIIMI